MCVNKFQRDLCWALDGMGGELTLYLAFSDFENTSMNVLLSEKIGKQQPKPQVTRDQLLHALIWALD